MICKFCGTELLDSDTFCIHCGKKVEKENKCHKCGEILREGTKFCPKCGVEIVHDEDDDIPVTGEMKTTDIPFDLIEQTIIFDAEQQVKSRDYKDNISDYSIEDSKYSDADYNENEEYSNNGYDEDEEYSDNGYDEGEEYSDNGYNEGEEYSDNGYDEGEEYSDYNYDENEEYLDEYSENEEEYKSPKIVTIIMIIAGILILLGIAAIFFSLKNKSTSNEVEEVTEQVEDIEEEEQISNLKGTVSIIKNVNVRNNPTTDGSEVLCVAKEGEVYEFLGYSNDSKNWVQIQLQDGSNGYVYKDYVSVTEN